MSGHTSGPWIVDHEEAVYVRAPSGGTICIMGWLEGRHTGPRRSPEEIAANARLIAAAPDLLEAAQRVLARGGHAGAHSEACLDGYECTCGADALRAAVEKATESEPAVPAQRRD